MPNLRGRGEISGRSEPAGWRQEAGEGVWDSEAGGDQADTRHRCPDRSGRGLGVSPSSYSLVPSEPQSRVKAKGLLPPLLRVCN